MGLDTRSDVAEFLENCEFHDLHPDFSDELESIVVCFWCLRFFVFGLQEARLFGPALFEAAKLKVLFLGADKEHPDDRPRIYTLTHSDVTSKITLAISREINKAQVFLPFLITAIR